MLSTRTWAITTVVVATGAFLAPAPPTTAQTPPIVVQQLGDRSVFTDGVEVKLKIEDHEGGTTVVSTKDASRTAVARITVQPGARFPWHTHAGPVLVNIDQGALTYVHGDCDERTYREGEAFADLGHGYVHSAYNPGPAEAVLYATFLEAPQEGPLSIPATASDCAQ